MNVFILIASKLQVLEKIGGVSLSTTLAIYGLGQHD